MPSGCGTHPPNTASIVSLTMKGESYTTWRRGENGRISEEMSKHH